MLEKTAEFVKMDKKKKDADVKEFLEGLFSRIVLKVVELKLVKELKECLMQDFRALKQNYYLGIYQEESIEEQKEIESKALIDNEYLQKYLNMNISLEDVQCSI